MSLSIRVKQIFSLIFWVTLFFLVDQLSKYWIVHHLAEGKEYPLLPFLSLFHTRNTGIAFSMLSSFSDIGLVILTFIIIIFILWLFWRSEPRHYLARFGYLLIIGGAIGNLADRIRLHYVVDFILFHIYGWSFAVFNLADTFITCGVACIFLNELLKIDFQKSKNNF